MAGRFLPFAALALAAAVATTACSSGNGSAPTTAPPPSSTITLTSPAPSPSRTGPLTTGPGIRLGERPPSLPVAALARDTTGALSFGHFFMNALDWSYATNDPYLLHQYSETTCQACVRYAAAIASLTAQGGTETGGRIHTLSVVIVEEKLDYGAQFVVKSTFIQDAAIVTRPSSEPSTITPSNETSVLLFIVWSDGWRMAEVTNT